jgi:hypothetical protein
MHNIMLTVICTRHPYIMLMMNFFVLWIPNALRPCLLPLEKRLFLRAHVHIHPLSHTLPHTHTHTHTRTLSHTLSHTHTHIHTLSLTHTHIHTHPYTRIRAHTYTHNTHAEASPTALWWLFNRACFQCGGVGRGTSSSLLQEGELLFHHCYRKVSP